MCSSTMLSTSSWSDLPTDLVKQILLNLPIKTLVRFKAVSQEWNDLISDPYFRAMRYRSILQVPNNSTNKKPIGALTTFVNYSKNASLKCTQALWNADDPRLLKDYMDVFRKPTGDGGTWVFVEQDQVHLIWISGPYHGVYLVHDLYDNAVMWNHATNEYKILSEVKEHAEGSWFLFGSYEIAVGVVDFLVMRIFYGESRRAPRLFKSSIGKWKDLKPIPRDFSCVLVGSMTLSINGVFYWLDGEQQIPYLFYFDTRTETYGKLKFPNDIPKQESLRFEPACYTENGILFPSLSILYKGKDKVDLWVKDEEECWIKKGSFDITKFVEAGRHKVLVETKADEWVSLLTYEESLYGFRCGKKTSLKTERKVTKKMARLSLKYKN